MQRHIIKRQVIEVQARNEAQARELQREISRVFRQRIIPLLDRCCTDLSAPDRLDRIELLEIDLGNIDPEQFESEFVAKLSEALPGALAAQISHQKLPAADGGSPTAATKSRSQLELLAFFARTGALPWWADASTPRLLETCFEFLLQKFSEPLARLMRELAQEKQPLQRLVNHAPDALLGRLTTMLIFGLKASDSAEFGELLRVLRKTKTAADETPMRLKRLFWVNLLRVAALEGKSHAGLDSFMQASLVRVAAALGSAYNDLIVELRQALQLNGGEGGVKLRGIFETFYQNLVLAGNGDLTRSDKQSSRDAERRFEQEKRAFSSEKESFSKPPDETIANALEKILAHLQVRDNFFTDFWRVLRTFVPGYPTQVREHLLSVLKKLELIPLATDSAAQASSLLLPVLTDRRIPEEMTQDFLAALQKLKQSGALAEHTATFLSTLLDGLKKHHLTHWKAADARRPNFWKALKTIIPEFPVRVQRSFLKLFDEQSGMDSSSEKPASQIVGDVLDLLTKELSLRSLTLQKSRDFIFALRKMRSAQVHAEKASAVLTALSKAIDRGEARALKTDESEKTVDLAFSDGDELYIGNAGLVILWPFLENFLNHVDLLEGKQFKSEGARERAAGLLQVLAAGEAEFPEYLLPLNKALCGMNLTDVFAFEPPLTESEAQECTNLLDAVIAHAPILRNMSVAGLRGTFLLRRGVLRTRDGAWLLQVERETHDVVLDRFPWGWEWVKLPWMETALRVEW